MPSRCRSFRRLSSQILLLSQLPDQHLEVRVILQQSVWKYKLLHFALPHKSAFSVPLYQVIALPENPHDQPCRFASLLYRFNARFQQLAADTLRLYLRVNCEEAQQCRSFGQFILWVLGPQLCLNATDNSVIVVRHQNQIVAVTGEQFREFVQ